MLTTKQIANNYFISTDITRKILARGEFAKYRFGNSNYKIYDSLEFHIDFSSFLYKFYAK